MFNKRLINERNELLDEVKQIKSELKERDTLRETIRNLKDDIEGLKSKKKIEEEDIRHMVRLKEERMEVKMEKHKLENDRTRDSDIAKVKDQYRDKLETRLEKEVTSMKEMYSQILERLPNVNIKGTL